MEKNKVIKNQDDVLIDKVAIYNFDVEDIQDIEALKKKNLITIENAPMRYIETNSGQQYQKIELEKCEHFDTFVCALSKCGKPYTKMELSENGKDGMRNLNCITLEQLKTKIDNAEHYLSDDLGILCNFDYAKIKYIELNKTFEIALDSIAYDRVVKTMINLMPTTASKIKKPIISDTTTYSASNKSQTETLKIYDKATQLKQKHKKEINANILRIEIQLINDANKIKTRFGSANLSDLTDEIITEYFSDYVTKNIINPFFDHLEFQEKQVKKILKDNYKKSDYEWIDNVIHIISDYEMIHEIPLMFDIEQMKDWLDVLNLPRQNKYYIYKRFRQKIVNYSTVYNNHDLQKYRELITKIECVSFD
ncbi:hypothetical protein DW996_00925 [Roseburia sp. AM51-8]|uniref:hypothetical protein n=1 Tax=Roseburia sp. AM51-8 TaxID=2292366 RepID=UPI000E4E4A5E|nr:hypothetical protein [Roseburia sp. AM51-8]RHQ02180.1 hypothetical protein DW996_00925 [Roseburia sp. AM51-8]